MQRRSFMALAGSGLVCGCGAVHQLPAVSDGNIAMAQAEVRMAPPPQRRWVSDDEVVRDPAHGDPARQGPGHEPLPRDECRRVRLEVPDVAQTGT